MDTRTSNPFALAEDSMPAYGSDPYSAADASAKAAGGYHNDNQTDDVFASIPAPGGVAAQSTYEQETLKGEPVEASPVGSFQPAPTRLQNNVTRLLLSLFFCAAACASLNLLTAEYWFMPIELVFVVLIGVSCYGAANRKAFLMIYTEYMSYSCIVCHGILVVVSGVYLLIQLITSSFITVVFSCMFIVMVLSTMLLLFLLSRVSKSFHAEIKQDRPMVRQTAAPSYGDLNMSHPQNEV